MRDQIAQLLTTRRTAGGIAKLTGATVDEVLSCLTVMVLDGAVRVIKNGKASPQYKLRTNNRIGSKEKLKQGINNRANIIRAIREMTAADMYPTEATIAARLKIGQQAVRYNLKILLRDGIVVRYTLKNIWRGFGRINRNARFMGLKRGYIYRLKRR
jgi:hypothetical protein